MPRFADAWPEIAMQAWATKLVASLPWLRSPPPQQQPECLRCWRREHSRVCLCSDDEDPPARDGGL